MLQHASLGFHKGSTPVSAPTCADGVSMLTDSGFKLQAMLSIAKTYSDDHHYQLHPAKATVTHMIKCVSAAHSTQMNNQLGEQEILSLILSHTWVWTGLLKNLLLTSMPKSRQPGQPPTHS